MQSRAGVCPDVIAAACVLCVFLEHTSLINRLNAESRDAESVGYEGVPYPSSTAPPHPTIGGLGARPRKQILMTYSCETNIVATVVTILVCIVVIKICIHYRMGETIIKS